MIWHFFSTVNFVPFGAGISSISTLLDLPFTLKGILCGSLQSQAHEPQPLIILIMFNFALLMAFSLAGTVSFASPNPIPT